MTVELIDIYGKKAGDSTPFPGDFLGKGPMPPSFKIPEILNDHGLNYGDLDTVDSATDAMSELVHWMEKQGWTPPPMLQGMRTQKEQIEFLKIALEIIAAGNTDPDRMVELAQKALKEVQ